jgi:site-specific recombinase XerD
VFAGNLLRVIGFLQLKVAGIGLSAALLKQRRVLVLDVSRPNQHDPRSAAGEFLDLLVEVPAMVSILRMCLCELSHKRIYVASAVMWLHRHFPLNLPPHPGDTHHITKLAMCLVSGERSAGWTFGGGVAHPVIWRDGPMAKERKQFLGHLRAEGYAIETLRQANSQIHLAATWLNLKTDQRVRPLDLQLLGQRWMADPPPARYRKHPLRRAMRLFVSRASQWLRFLGRLRDERVSEPCDAVIDQFVEFGRSERGLAELTIQQHRESARAFLRWYDLHRHADLSHLHPRDLSAYVREAPFSGWSRRTIATQIGNLRVFLRWLSQRGLCSASLVDCITAPRVYTHERYPLGPTWDQVQALVASADSTRPSDIRDRAILLLLSVYGFRAGEIVGLRLDDIDWENETIRPARPKQRRVSIYPLVREVGDAIIAYLRKVRPKCRHRHVFLPVQAPCQPLTAACVGVMVRCRQRQLGQQLRQFGPHGIRHACATHLLAQGFSLKQIGDYLGHSMIRATEAYAKVDLASLRQVGELPMSELTARQDGRDARQMAFYDADMMDGLRTVAESSLGDLL